MQGGQKRGPHTGKPTSRQRGVFVNESGEILREIVIFNVPVGETRYLEAVLRQEAREIGKVTRQYVEDIEEQYPQELWTMLQFSLHHRITYWLRTCTPKETEEMAEHVGWGIMEAVQAATGVDFDLEAAARERLRLPARMKGGGIKRAADTRRPAFLGALLDVLPRCIDKKSANGEDMPGYYAEQLTEVLGKGVHDAEGHMNEKFLEAENIEPFLEACKEAWAHIEREAMKNYDITKGVEHEEWGKLGPLAEPTPANAKNIGSAYRRRRRTERGSERERTEEQGPGGMGGQGSRRGAGQATIVGQGDNEEFGRGERSDESEKEEI